ncbi:MAG: alpha/beta hydrolase [Nitrospira sp.]|nr:alpha/beta hydrolase [Nitrospira sp.]
MLTALPARITVGSATWDGTITNLSLGGTCVMIPGDFPAAPPQHAYVIVKTAVGILELHGIALARTISQRTDTSAAQLVVAFEPSKQETQAILSSLLHATQEQTLPLSVEIQLTTQTIPGQTTADTFAATDERHQNPREAIRIALQFPVKLDIRDTAGRSHSFGALTTNLSRTGVSLKLHARPELLSNSVTLHFSALQTQPQPDTLELGTPDTTLTASMIWSMPDPTAPKEFRHPGADPALRVGLRFHTLTPHAEREVNRVIRQYLASPSRQALSLQQTSVLSLPRECRNLRGQTIAVTEDHLHPSLASNTPILIIAPGFGHTALDTLALSYFLAQHRLRILRYDHTNHVGLSDGDLQQTTLRSMQTDLLKVVELAQQTWPTAPLIVLASDVTARVALKVAKHTRPLDLLILINPVVDMQATLMSVHRHDLVTDHRYGLRRGIANLLGLNIDVDRFVGDLVAGHLIDLASTISDLRLLHVPSTILTTPPHPLSPLPPADLPQAFLTALGPHAKLATIPTPLHGQSPSPDNPFLPAFQQILEQIAAAVAIPTAPIEFSMHTQHELRRQQRIELERTRLHHNLSHLTREALRNTHLQQVPQLGNLHEYWKLLDDFYRLLSPLEPNTLLLDAEVGYGDLVRATMLNQAYRSRQRSGNPVRPVHMIGIGHSRDALSQARKNLRALHRELDIDFSGTLTTHPPLTTNWILTHWAENLPFKNNSLHRIACNLSLPFVSSPLATIRELYRILRPQGCLVITFFRPDTDLSGVYRRHLQQANQDEFTPQAQLLLQYFGRLREAILHGLLHTFDQPTLNSFLRQAGIVTFRILPALDGQAFFAVIEKDKSAS